MDTRLACEGIEDFRIAVCDMLWGGGGEANPIGQHISNMQTIWLLSSALHDSAVDEKSTLSLKIITLWDMAYSIAHLVPTQF